jgi:hypothetical protein
VDIREEELRKKKAALELRQDGASDLLYISCVGVFICTSGVINAIAVFIIRFTLQFSILTSGFYHHIMHYNCCLDKEEYIIPVM